MDNNLEGEPCVHGGLRLDTLARSRYCAAAWMVLLLRKNESSLLSISMTMFLKRFQDTDPTTRGRSRASKLYTL